MAHCDVLYFISFLLPVNLNFLAIDFFSETAAIKTVPTGLSSEPPDGPVIPVIPIPISVDAVFFMPSAIARAVSMLTALWVSSVS